MKTIETIEDRFWSKVDKSAGESACWNWIASKKSENGYGQIRINDGRGYHMKYAHRIAWVLKHGEIPNKLWVLHKCDNRSCVNPSHLWLGTSIDNNRDMICKNRHWSKSKPWIAARGEAGGMSKLTAGKVKIIRSKWKTGKYRQKDLGNAFGVSQHSIWCVVHRKTWVHIN